MADRTPPFKRIVIVVLDSLGVGALPDADEFGDAGADTVGHLVRDTGLCVPNLAGLGLARISGAGGEFRAGAYGRNRELSNGKDTTAGHWEMAGLVVERAFQVFPRGFPAEIVSAFAEITGQEPLGNEVASGTEIIQRLGAEHQATGRAILYTSADSVFQVAAHEDTIGLDELYRWCREARAMLDDRARVARVIARPFIGTAGKYTRTPSRRDFSVEPEGRTVLDDLAEAHLAVHGVGKISDIFDGRGITSSVKAKSDMEGVDQTIAALKSVEQGLVFVNLVQLDQDFGHRRNAEGYRDQLQLIDQRVPELLSALGQDDMILFTGDHGTDPTFRGTDHTREYTPLLCYAPGITDVSLGDRSTFADIAATIADNFHLPAPAHGQSFLDSLR